MSRKLLFCIPALASGLTIGSAASQTQGGPDPVRWSLKFESATAPPGAEVLADLTAAIQPGWHLYSLTTPKGGPNATKVILKENSAITGLRVFEPAPIRAFDRGFNLETETFEKDVTLKLQVRVDSKAMEGPVAVEVQARYQACQETLCLPPVSKAAQATLTVNRNAKKTPYRIASGYTEVPSR